ncbi:hypothetical protein JB92DRAFT_2938599, partial [Gautieria morchelliformis]
MRQTDSAIVSRSHSLPYDLVHSHIIPDILSEHLHLLLVAPVAPCWHAFYTLPLVSFSFLQTCRSLWVPIFGLNKDEDPRVIHEVLSFAQSLWSQAKRSPETSRPVLEYTYAQLMGGSSLIRIYMCIALARSFLNYDVLRYIGPAERDWQFATLEHGFLGVDVPCRDIGESVGRSRMPDQTMHRLFLPLTCAMKLCDSILPERLALIVAEYLADIVPFIATAPVMLKYSQDLHSYVTREHRIEGETWIKWMHQTLGLVEDTELLVKEMQGTGRLVQSFPRSSSIPCEVLQVTGIIHNLRKVARTDWGTHSVDIHGRANSLLREWDIPFDTF